MSEFLKHTYSKIADSYEKTNHIFTLWLDILWRKRLARIAISTAPKRILDACTGTGETARCIKKFSGGLAEVVGCDFSKEMLRLAKRRKGGGGIELKEADVSKLPFESMSFDVITMSFAARNLNSGTESFTEYLREIRRVLKDGGVFYNLETSRPKNRLIAAIFRLYVKLLVPWIGKRFSGHGVGYKYLAASIISFMDPDELSQKLKEAGFTKVGYKRLLMGVAAIHYGTR